MGFPGAQLPFDVPARPHGKRSFSILKRFLLSSYLISAFSSVPIQFITLLGSGTLLIAVIFGGNALYQKFIGTAVSGFATVILLLLILGSSIMIGLGVIGLYLYQIYHEVKRRPLWMLDDDRCRLSHDEKVKGETDV